MAQQYSIVSCPQCGSQYSAQNAAMRVQCSACNTVFQQGQIIESGRAAPNRAEMRNQGTHQGGPPVVAPIGSQPIPQVQAPVPGMSAQHSQPPQAPASRRDQFNKNKKKKREQREGGNEELTWEQKLMYRVGLLLVCAAVISCLSGEFEVGRSRRLIQLLSSFGPVVGVVLGLIGSALIGIALQGQSYGYIIAIGSLVLVLGFGTFGFFAGTGTPGGGPNDTESEFLVQPSVDRFGNVNEGVPNPNHPRNQISNLDPAGQPVAPELPDWVEKKVEDAMADHVPDVRPANPALEMQERMRQEMMERMEQHQRDHQNAGDANASYTVDQKVQVKWGASWFDATILSVDTSAKSYEVHYDGWGDERNEAGVGPARIRLRDE